MTLGYYCPVQSCKYVGQTPESLRGHLAARHPEELRPPPVAPPYTPIAPGARRGALYLRVSTVDQHPENQLPYVRMAMAGRGYELARKPDGTPAIYEDRASGKTTDREQLQALLRDCMNNSPPPYDAVFFLRMSRLGRSLRDNMWLFDTFQSLGVALVSASEPYDTTTPSGRLIRNLMSSVAEYQRENIIEQSLEGIARRRAEGKMLGRHPAGCGIPRELGGLGPCPEGVDHKGIDLDALRAKADERKAWAERKARQRERTKQKARVTTPPSYPGALPFGDAARPQGV